MIQIRLKVIVLIVLQTVSFYYVLDFRSAALIMFVSKKLIYTD